MSSRFLGQSLEEFKAAISKRNGLASPSRFLITFTPPRGSLLNLDLPGIIQSFVSNGSFNPMSLLNDPRDVGIFCTAVNLPGRQITTMDYQVHRQGQKVPTGTILEDVTASFLVTNDYWIKKMFDQWSTAVIDFKRYRAKYRNEFTSDVTIQQLDKNNVPTYGVTLQRAYPVTVTSIQMDSEASNQVQKLTVVFAYDELLPQNAITSSISAVKNVLNEFGSLANVTGIFGG